MSKPRSSSPGFRLTAASEDPTPLRVTVHSAEPPSPPPYSTTPTTRDAPHHGLFHPSSWFHHSEHKPEPQGQPKQHSGKLLKMACTFVGSAASPDVVTQAVEELANVPFEKRADAMLPATELYPDAADVRHRIRSLSVMARLARVDAPPFVRSARAACAGCADAMLLLEVVNALREVHPHTYSDGANNGAGGHIVLYWPAHLAEMDALTELWSGIADAEARRSLLGSFVSLEVGQHLEFVAQVSPLKTIFSYPSLVKIIAKIPREKRAARCEEFVRAVDTTR